MNLSSEYVNIIILLIGQIIGIKLSYNHDNWYVITMPY